MTATYRKRYRGRPAGAAATCRLCGAGSTSPGFWARKAAAACLLTHPWRDQRAWQRGAAAAATAWAGSVGGRGPSHGRVRGAAAAAGGGAGAGAGTGEESAGRGGRRRRRRPGPHREDEPGGCGLQPLQPPDGIETNGNCKRL